MGVFIDLTGQIFGNRKVLGIDRGKYKDAIGWRVECECGFVSTVPANHLKYGLADRCVSCAGKRRMIVNPTCGSCGADTSRRARNKKLCRACEKRGHRNGFCQCGAAKFKSKNCHRCRAEP